MPDVNLRQDRTRREPEGRCNRHNRHPNVIARVVATETQAMVGPEQILTERLRLRPPTASDAERIFGATAKTHK